jgi:choline-sulfatase
VGYFQDDGYHPPAKKQHPLSTDSSNEKLEAYRAEYDAFVAHIDSEFGRAVDALRAGGVLDRTYLFVTSDHGEMFERGTFGHFTPLLYEPVIRVPLLVSVPGSTTRMDVRAPTSSVDLLPTVLGLANGGVEPWIEGQALPGLGGREDWSRSTFAVEAKRNPSRQPLRNATYAVTQGNRKLIHYAGYAGRYEDYSEVYDLENDPEEMSNLADKAKGSAWLSSMRAELRDRIEAANAAAR